MTPPVDLDALRLTEWTSCGGCAAKWGASMLGELVAARGGNTYAKRTPDFPMQYHRLVEGDVLGLRAARRARRPAVNPRRLHRVDESAVRRLAAAAHGVPA